MPNLKNYTSTVPADKSISKIERLLVDFGAENINKTYNKETKKLDSISFLINIPGITNTMAFKVPAKVDRVFDVLWAQYKKPTPTTKQRVLDQSERTAWKIVCDWVEIQVSMIQLEQAEFIEVFLPYVYDPEKNQTFFEKLKETNFKQLNAKN